MRLIAFIVLVLLGQELCAQFGVRIKAQRNDYQKWNQVIQGIPGYQDAQLFQNSYEVGLDYWFRLKNHRIEFYPEISVGLSSTDFNNTSNSELPDSYRLEKGSIGLNVHLYFLDFKNDCNCPTFSKQSTFFKKGLFLMLGVHEYVQNKETSYSDRSLFDRDFTARFATGIGLDLGMNDLFTITPFINALYYPNTTWDGINADHGIINILPPDESASNVAFELGIRLGFRPDYLKNGR